MHEFAANPHFYYLAAILFGELNCHNVSPILFFISFVTVAVLPSGFCRSDNNVIPS
jgi:hypothetical protein